MSSGGLSPLEPEAEFEAHMAVQLKVSAQQG